VKLLERAVEKPKVTPIFDTVWVFRVVVALPVGNPNVSAICKVIAVYVFRGAARVSHQASISACGELSH